MRHRLLPLILLLILPFFSLAQSFVYSGKVLNSKTKKPLAFVSVTIAGQNRGVQSDIDGKFKLYSNKASENFRFAFVGYEPVLITLNSSNELSIQMIEKSFSIKEVVVVAGENPAHRIIKRTIANRDVNNPEKLTSFQYVSYNKFVFTGTKKQITDSIQKKKSDSTYLSYYISKLDTNNKAEFQRKKDSIILNREKQTMKNDSFFNAQHIFMTESVTDRTFMHPDLNNEVVKASKISGLKNPQFVLMASQFQSFSFYKDYISIVDKNYLSPVSPGSTTRYFFNIEDTLYTGNDSVFVISFKPMKGKNFDALKGVLYINTNGYAIQNVLAEPAKPASFTIKIQQLYEQIDGKYWFPTQLNTDIDFNIVQVNDRKMVGIGRTYVKDIKIGIPLRKRDLSNMTVDYDSKSIKNSSEILEKYRIDTLSQKELKTYHVIDSIGKAERIDEKLKVYSVITKGYIPLGYVNLDIKKILALNKYEGVRLGAGFNTSSKVSEKFSLGVYGAYGIKDEGFKYGGNLDLYLYKRSNVVLSLKYMNDVSESGATVLRGERVPFLERYRNLAVYNMDKIELKEAELSFHSLGYLTSTFFVNEINKQSTNAYTFIGDSIPRSNFTFNEIGVTLRYAFREKLMRQADQIVSAGTKYPVVWLQLTNGMNNFSFSKSQYLKLDLKLQKNFLLRNLGKTFITAQAGIIEGHAPVPFAYFSKANEQFLNTRNSFETMGMNEFLSSEYAALYFLHDFGRLLVRSQMFKPTVSIATNISFGDLKNKSDHAGITYKTLEKGYFESGILLGNLLPTHLRKRLQGKSVSDDDQPAFFSQRLGVSTYFRYGANSSNAIHNNIYWKLNYVMEF